MSDLNYTKSVELIIGEGVQLVKQLEQALARERGGGTPLTTVAYMALRKDALTWIRQNE